MEDRPKEIYYHDSDITVTHKINATELDNWINHLNYINKELKNLIALCGEDLNGKIDEENVSAKLHKKKSENETLLRALLKYLHSREKIIECEDTHCDMAYIKNHESYRWSYLYHLDKYRRLKDEFFGELLGKMDFK